MKKHLLFLILLLNLSYQSKAQTVDTLMVHNWGYGGSSGYYINNILGEGGGGCMAFGNWSGPAIMVAIIDSCTGQPWNNLNVDHGNWNLYCVYPVCAPDYYVCRQRAENYFVYSFNDTLSFSRLHEWIRDSVPDNDLILIYSWTTYSYSNSPQALNNLIYELGCPAWPAPDSVPFTYFVKKGQTSVMDTIVVGASPLDSAFLTVTFTTGADCPVGISEIDKETDGVISPNPAHDNFTINITGELKIYDVTGRLVKEQTVNRKQEIVNCILNAGIYFVQVRDGKKVHTQKLIVE